MNDSIPHGALYQFRYARAKPIGSCVDLGPINDKYGYVVSHKDTNEQGVLHLIRGTGNTAAYVANGQLKRLVM
jgi:hypothetical protein